MISDCICVFALLICISCRAHVNVVLTCVSYWILLPALFHIPIKICLILS